MSNLTEIEKLKLGYIGQFTHWVKEILHLKKPEFEFHGYDWTELARCWGLLTYKEPTQSCWHEDDDTVERLICEYIYNNINDQECINDVRRFMEAICWMGKRYDFEEYPVWQGIADIKNDQTFLHFVCINLRTLWT